MAFAEMLPYISAAAQVATLAGLVIGGTIALAKFLGIQAAQHQANISRLDHFTDRLDQLTDRLKAIEEIGRQQTNILVSFGRIEERVDAQDHRLSQLESRDAGRRIAAAKG